jgi:PAS domain S-box-containing protein
VDERAEAPMVLAEDLLTALHKSPLPFALVDVDALVILDANQAARRLIGLSGRDVATPLQDVVLPDRREKVYEILALLDDGALDAYQAQREFQAADGTLVAGEMWVQSIRELMPHAALAVFTPDADSPALMIDLEDDGAHVAHNAPVVVGALDVELRIIRVSADTHDLFGRRAESLHGTPFVDVIHPDDVAAFLMATGRALAGSAGFGQRMRVRSGDDDWVSVRMHLAPLSGGAATQLGFVLASAPAEIDLTDRSTELEQRLWRIALEVQAAGVLDAMHEVPSVPVVHDLSSRQWEVLARLQRGERVPGIAREMYVSQSTVRNHLAAIFRKTGVNSQAELLALLRENRSNA